MEFNQTKIIKDRTEKDRIIENIQMNTKYLNGAIKDCSNESIEYFSGKLTAIKEILTIQGIFEDYENYFEGEK
jgi:hypothetical protein